MHDSEMDTQKGGMKEFGGKVEKTAGDLTGNEDMQAKGTENQAKGKAQNMWGKAKDTAGDVADNVKDAFDPNSKDPNMNNRP